jgi:hypothetical protein
VTSHRDNSGAFSAVVYIAEDEKKAAAKEADWKGHVPATRSDWTHTGVSVSKGDKVMLIAAGTTQYDSRGRSLDLTATASIRQRKKPAPTFVLPEALAEITDQSG